MYNAQPANYYPNGTREIWIKNEGAGTGDGQLITVTGFIGDNHATALEFKIRVYSHLFRRLEVPCLYTRFQIYGKECEIDDPKDRSHVFIEAFGFQWFKKCEASWCGAYIFFNAFGHDYHVTFAQDGDTIGSGICVWDPDGEAEPLVINPFIEDERIKRDDMEEWYEEEGSKIFSARTYWYDYSEPDPEDQEKTLNNQMWVLGNRRAQTIVFGPDPEDAPILRSTGMLPLLINNVVNNFYWHYFEPGLPEYTLK